MRTTAPTSAPAELQQLLDDHRPGTDGEVYGITDLVKEFGVTARAIRLYEERGLLAPRRVGSARIFSRRDRARLTLIVRAKVLGYTLDEIKEYLDLYGQHGEGRRQQLEYLVRRVRVKRTELLEMRSQIDKALAELEIIHTSAEQQLARKKAEHARR
jgi:DNA-binding transcriptional MerR regulator